MIIDNIDRFVVKNVDNNGFIHDEKNIVCCLLRKVPL